MSGVNYSLFETIYSLARRSGFLDFAGIFFAKYLIYFLVLGMLVFFFRMEGKRKRLFFLGESLLAALLARGVVTEAIRFFYTHPRPFDALGFTPLIGESGNSFPSGHMTFLFALAMVLYFYNKKWGLWYMAASFAVGIARIFAGVHWPADVLGGIVIGILSAILVHKILAPYFGKIETEKSLTGEAV